MSSTMLPVLVIGMAVGAAADPGDDFSNNLFSDLAPLLSLFGEQFAKQYMRASMGWIDNVIFALAPLGILTAITCAIRVGGSPWLRSLVGRARESRASVELELMSSTSEEVCELWNGHDLVRYPGRHQVQREIIYLHALRDDESTSGLYTLEEAARSGLLVQGRETRDPVGSLWRGLVFWCRQKLQRPQSLPDVEGSQQPQNTAFTVPNAKHVPAISLNLDGGRSRDIELVLVAMCGIALQAGMLAFSALSVYHPTFSVRFPKDGGKVAAYAFPIMAAGTILLAVGMVICTAVVETSTDEVQYSIDPKLNAEVFWLQRNVEIADQAFEATLIRGPAPGAGAEGARRILTSQRAARADTKIPFVPAWILSTWTEAATLAGVAFGLLGFILQFQGFRGLNWSTSIVQLGCISLMTALRAWLRRHLVIAPLTATLPRAHELDWLALLMAGGKWADARTHSGMDIGLLFDDGTAYSWKVTIPTSSAPSEPLGMARARPREAGQKCLQIRQRLACLAGWPGAPANMSVALAKCIGWTLDALIGHAHEPGAHFSWSLPVEVNGVAELIDFRAELQDKVWTVGAVPFDAVLSLWLFHIQQTSLSLTGSTKHTHPINTTPVEAEYNRGLENDWNQDRQLQTLPIFRVLGPRIFEEKGPTAWPWVGDRSYTMKGSGMALIDFIAGTVHRPFQSNAPTFFPQLVGFLPEYCEDAQRNQTGLGLLLESPVSLHQALAQHLFINFIWSLIKDRRIRLDHRFTEFTESAEDGKQKLSNKILERLVQSFEESGLYVAQEANVCINLALLHSPHEPLQRIVTNGQLNIVGHSGAPDFWSIHKAVVHGGISAVDLILSFSDRPMAILSEKVEGSTVLHLAIERNYTEYLRLLVERGAPLEEYNGEGKRPLFLAAEYGRLEMVKILLDAGAEVESWMDEAGVYHITNNEVSQNHSPRNLKRKVFSTPYVRCPGALSIAAAFGHTEVVRELLRRGALADQPRPYNIKFGSISMTFRNVAIYSGALAAAVGGGHRETAGVLLNAGARGAGISPGVICIDQIQIDQRRRKQDSSLTIIGSSVIITNGFEIRKRAEFAIYGSALGAAVVMGEPSMVACLLAAGVAVDDRLGGSVYIGPTFRTYDRAKVFIEYTELCYRGKLDSRDQSKHVAYSGAIAGAVLRGNAEILNMLLDAGADATKVIGATIMMDADYLLTDTSKWIFEYRDMFIQGKLGVGQRCAVNGFCTPLSMATARKDTACVDLLLRDRRDETPCLWGSFMFMGKLWMTVRRDSTCNVNIECSTHFGEFPSLDDHCQAVFAFNQPSSPSVNYDDVGSIKLLEAAKCKKTKTNIGTPPMRLLDQRFRQAIKSADVGKESAEKVGLVEASFQKFAGHKWSTYVDFKVTEVTKGYGDDITAFYSRRRARVVDADEDEDDDEDEDGDEYEDGWRSILSNGGDLDREELYDFGGGGVDEEHHDIGDANLRRMFKLNEEYDDMVGGEVGVGENTEYIGSGDKDKGKNKDLGNDEAS
ncbi:hypothetical protein DFH27DRAFT_585703 [Peziza echinospora]|nr:hypothetical protein DFH27DRAFT_585703 [Peziza echinospora]